MQDTTEQLECVSQGVRQAVRVWPDWSVDVTRQTDSEGDSGGGCRSAGRGRIVLPECNPIKSRPNHQDTVLS